MTAAIAYRVILSACSLPVDLVLKLLRSEDSVQHYLQVMTHGRVTMQVQGTGRLQDTPKFRKSRSHVHQICHEIVLAYERIERPQRAS